MECQTNSLSSFSKGNKVMKQVNGHNKASASQLPQIRQAPSQLGVPECLQAESRDQQFCFTASLKWPSQNIVQPTLTFPGPLKEDDPLQFSSGIPPLHRRGICCHASGITFVLHLPFLLLRAAGHWRIQGCRHEDPTCNVSVPGLGNLKCPIVSRSISTNS